jgi:pimeloyl-ACP methyl ester carboxylesterase
VQLRFVRRRTAGRMELGLRTRRPDGPWLGRPRQSIPFLHAAAKRERLSRCGHGLSTHGDSSGTASSVPDFAEAVIAVGRTIGEIAAVIGHSAGSAAGSYAFTRGFKVGCSVHLASPCSFDRGVDRFASLVGLSGADHAESPRRGLCPPFRCAKRIWRSFHCPITLPCCCTILRTKKCRSPKPSFSLPHGRAQLFGPRLALATGVSCKTSKW